jgi:hypothetical protein
MPKRRYERREPTNEWQQIRPLLKDTVQITYEVIRPVVLCGQTPKERGAETGVSPRTIFYRANLFDQASMAAMLATEPPPPVPNRTSERYLPTFDKRSWTSTLNILPFGHMRSRPSVSSSQAGNSQNDVCAGEQRERAATTCSLRSAPS